MTHRYPAEDLLVRARQCRLGPADERQLEIAVRSSRELELLYDAGLQFDSEAILLPGDETLLTSLVERTLAAVREKSAGTLPLQEAPVRRGPSSYRALAVRYFAASLALSLLLYVALASAWDHLKASQMPPAAGPSRTQVVVRARRHAAPIASVPGISSGITSSIVRHADTTAARIDKNSGATLRKLNQSLPIQQRREAPPSAVVLRGLDASELFSRANVLRRQGDSEGARRLYQRVCEQYPSSVEAQDAKLLIGNLLLSGQAPTAALRSFEGYGEGALQLEALWGRAEALRKLRSPQERGVLEELIRTGPSSPYAVAARARLKEIPP